MKYVTAALLVVVCIMGIVTMRFIFRDSPQYAEGEPITIVKDWLSKQPSAASTISSIVPPGISANTSDGENSDKVIWTEEYLGNGKWLVSRAALSSGYSRTEMTFEEWIARTRGWNAERLDEYASDLSPEERVVFQEQMRVYNPGQAQFTDIIDEWHLYEKSGLVEVAHD